MTKKMNKCFALVGNGYWGKKIAAELDKLGIDFFICDVNTSQINDNFRYIDFETLLMNDQIKTVFLATPEETHFHLAKQLLEAAKHVFVEKPLALHKTEAIELCKIVQKNNTCLFVDYIFLYDIHLQKIKEIIDYGKIGKIKKIESTRYSVGFYKPKVTVFDDLAMHDLYIFRYLVGENILDFSVSNLSDDGTTIVEGTVEYKSGNISYKAHYSWIQPNSERRITIEGEKGTIIWDKTKKDLEIITQQSTEEMRVNSQPLISPLQLSIKEFLRLSSQESIQLRKQRYIDYVSDVSMLESIRDQAHSSLQSSASAHQA